jgi:hypothetical protein
MSVVNASQIDGCAPTLDRLTFIHQHANPHRFEIGNHADSIVISEHTVDRPLNACQNSTNECKCIFKVADFIERCLPSPAKWSGWASLRRQLVTFLWRS